MPSDRDLRDHVAAMLRRASLTEIDTTGGQHMVRARGIGGEEVVAPRIKDFGFSSSPPSGSIGLLAALGGRSDRAMLLGLDHAGHGPRDLATGHTAIYDAAGNLISLVGTRARIVAPIVVVISPDIRLGSEAAAARVMTEAGPATKVKAE